MSEQWKPGDVALVDSWRGKGELAFRVVRDGTPNVWVVLSEGDSRGLAEGEVTLARPVVILDPENLRDLGRLEKLIDNWASRVPYSDMAEPGDLTPVTALQAAVREFATRPQVPAEPTDPGVRVYAYGTYWAKVTTWWVSPSLAEHPREWDSLVEADDFAAVAQ